MNVSAIGLASSLRGGNLILTELRGTDGQIYALAQGGLTVSGVEVSAEGSEIRVGIPTAGRIPGGAIIEREVVSPFERSEYVVLNTNQADFTTTSSITTAINENFGAGTARSIDATSVVVRAPEDINEEARPMFVFKPGVNLRDIVDAVNQVGATPSSLIAILDALKSSGSLRAELIVI